MFKNSLKIVMLADVLCLSASTAVCSFSSHITTATNNTLLPQKTNWMRSLQRCRTMLRPDLLVRQYPFITLCVGLGICGGIYACYSGLLSSKHGKNVKIENTTLSFYEKGCTTMKHWFSVITISLGLASQTTSPTEQEEVFKDLIAGFDKGFSETEQIKEELKNPLVIEKEEKSEKFEKPKSSSKKIKRKKPLFWTKNKSDPQQKKIDNDKTPEEFPFEAIMLKKKNWGEEFLEAMVFNPYKLQAIWDEKINNNTTKEQFKKIDQQFRNDLKTGTTYKRNTSLLCATAEYLDLNHVTQLLNLGADASEVIKNTKNTKIDKTPLFAATQNITSDNVQIVQELLNRGAKSTINEKLKQDCSIKKDLTALHRAIHDNIFELVKLLVENGARLDLKDNEGDTPLHYAVKYSLNENLHRYLLDHGANGNTLNNKNEAPWQIARGNYSSLKDWMTHLYQNVYFG